MNPGDYREQIYDIFTQPGIDPDEKITDALDVGTEYLDLPIGFLTRIDAGTQEIVHATGDHPLVRPGERCPLEEAYCRRTIAIDSTLAVQNAAVSTAISEQAFDTFELGTYIGAKVTVNDETYGTICFADQAAREQPFTEAEEIFVELIAKLTGQAFERQAYEQDLQARNEELQEEKQRFEAIAETSYDIIFRVDLGGEFTYVSSAVERVLGYDPAELVGEPFVEFMTDRAIEDAMAAYERVLANQTIENRELAFRDVNGETVLIEINAIPIMDEGEITGVQGVGRDITARRERERELRLKNRAMDDAGVGILIADLTRSDRPIIYANDGMGRLLDTPVAEILDQPFRSVLGDVPATNTASRFDERVTAGEAVTGELINYRADGTPFWNQVRAMPIEDASGAPTHYLGFVVEITDRKRREQLIGLLNRVLRHNLRNDMNVILGFADEIQAISDESAGSYAGRIQTTAERLASLSEQARELEQVARYERTPERFAPATLLDDIVTSYRERYPDASIEVSVETEQGICAGDEIREALTELLENALKHSGSEPWVRIDVGHDGDWIELTIEDDGPGIDDLEAAVIAKGEETALEHGSGLGLWLVNWIVTRYGGSFQIGANETGGTTARLRLPGIDSSETVEDAARKPTTLFQ
ncbi:MAG: PAS domain S-box protein [Halobacteriales archaeon]|nr:PAS domain S-box protein [Halobacteriales archaeon]